MNGEVRFGLDSKDKQKMCCVCVEGNNVILEYPEERRKLQDDRAFGLKSTTIRKKEIINLRIASGTTGKFFTFNDNYYVIKVYTSFHETIDLIFLGNEQAEYKEALKLLKEVYQENQESN